VKSVHKVSIVVPVYNLENYVLSILQHIKIQTYKNLEVIIVNDGSKDSSLDVVNSFFKENSDLSSKIISIENSGVSKARNLGIDACEGEYVLIIDGDDGLKEDTVEKLVIRLEEEAADICFTGYEEYTDFRLEPFAKYSDAKDFLNVPVSGLEALKLKLEKKIWICTGNALYRRDMLEKYRIRYTENMAYGEDIEFIGRCLFHANKVACVNENLVKILSRPNSALHSGFSLKYLDALKTNRQLYNYVKSSNRNIIEADKTAIEMLIDYDYINIYLGIVKKINEKYGLFGAAKANKEFNELGISLENIDYKKVINNINNFKTKELNIFFASKTAYFYSCKMFNLLKKLKS
jgi:glycosyltransferase involved in cell wall biosynthesis